MECLQSQEINESINGYIRSSDQILSEIYNGTNKIQDKIYKLYGSNILLIIPKKEINEKEILGCFLKFTKGQLKRANVKIKHLNNADQKIIKVHYSNLIKLVESNKSEDKTKYYKKFIALVGEIIFNMFDYLPTKENLTESKENSVKNFILGEFQKLSENNNISFIIILKYIKYNHLIFSIDDSFLKLTLIINIFFCLWGRFSDYPEFLLNLYYMYYRFRRIENLNEFKQSILSKIDPIYYDKFDYEEKSINIYIAKLLFELENLVAKGKEFKLNIDEKLLNNGELLNIFHLAKIDKKYIKKFFNFYILQKNYLNYSLNKNEDFQVSIDDLNYDENKLNVFNGFFLVACGLIDKIESDSLQIFNEDNHSIRLFQKYAEILLKNINDKINSIKNETNLQANKEIFGFGKIFRTFFVLYTNLDNDFYRNEKLKFDLNDNLSQKSEFQNKIEKINIILSQKESITNFSRKSNESKKDLNDEQKYFENLNAYSVEENCKTYIMSHIEDIISNNEDKIKPIEIYKIFFSLNYYIPYVDENFSLKFIPVTKKLKNLNTNNPDYGYQEFDYLFYVSSKKDISMNEIETNEIGLPFIQNMKINILYLNESNSRVNIDSKGDKGFTIKKNSLVLVENKLKFPKIKEKLHEYLALMIKKYNFVLELIKNTTKDLHRYINKQLFLIYDDIIIDSNEIKDLISEKDIKSILKSIPLKENLEFTIEIIYMSQLTSVYNISYMYKKMKEMEEELKSLKEVIRTSGLLDKKKKKE